MLEHRVWCHLYKVLEHVNSNTFLGIHLHVVRVYKHALDGCLMLWGGKGMGWGRVHRGSSVVIVIRYFLSLVTSTEVCVAFPPFIFFVQNIS